MRVSCRFDLLHAAAVLGLRSSLTPARDSMVAVFVCFFLLAFCVPYCPLFPLSLQVVCLLGLPRLVPVAASFGLLFDSSRGEPRPTLPCIFKPCKKRVCLNLSSD
jgi:hypothetical protein